MIPRLRTLLAFLAGAAALAVPAGYAAWRLWPPALPGPPAARLPIVRLLNGTTHVEPPDGIVVAQVGRFTDEITAYLHFDELSGLRAAGGRQLLLAVAEGKSGPVYRILIVLGHDVITAVADAAELQSKRVITGFDLAFPTAAALRAAEEQTWLLQAAYNLPPAVRLEELKDDCLLPAMARFVAFKSGTDPRVRQRIVPVPVPVTLEQARTLAADILTVARFYDLPLDLFLAIGAIENNYMSVTGDREHTRWKSRAEPGDLVLARRRGRVLVWNYSMGVWQITRETLRRAHALYLADTRDYGKLPQRLRPAAALDLSRVDGHVLTTYAGILLRSLLDRFGEDTDMALAAYNGGIRSPNLVYAFRVVRIAEYARRVVAQAALRRSRRFAMAPSLAGMACPPAVARVFSADHASAGSYSDPGTPYSGHASLPRGTP